MRNTQVCTYYNSTIVFIGMAAGLQIYLFALAITYQIIVDDPATLIVSIRDAQDFVVHHNIETISPKDMKEFAEIRVQAVNKQNQADFVYGVTIVVYSAFAYMIVYLWS